MSTRELSLRFLVALAFTLAGYRAISSTSDSDPATPPADTTPTPVRIGKTHTFTISEEYYSQESKLHGEEGLCAVRIQVDSNGAINAVQIVSSTGFARLDASCLSAFVNGKLFLPTVKGKPLPKWIQVPTEWRLANGHRHFTLSKDFLPAVPTIAKDYALRVGPDFYPKTSRQMRQEGICGLHVDVAADGALSKVSVVKSTGFSSLDQACVEAVQQAQFSPEMKEGVPIPASTNIYMTWRLPSL